jgi:hypothetical protein
MLVGLLIYIMYGVCRCAYPQYTHVLIARGSAIGHRHLSLFVWLTGERFPLFDKRVAIMRLYWVDWDAVVTHVLTGQTLRDNGDSHM